MFESLDFSTRNVFLVIFLEGKRHFLFIFEERYTSLTTICQVFFQVYGGVWWEKLLLISCFLPTPVLWYVAKVLHIYSSFNNIYISDSLRVFLRRGCSAFKYGYKEYDSCLYTLVPATALFMLGTRSFATIAFVPSM